MWVHVVIFMATAGIGIAWKAGWAPPGWICRQGKYPVISDRGSLWKLSWNGSDDDQRCKRNLYRWVSP